MRQKLQFSLLCGLLLFGWNATPARAELWSWATETAISRFSPEDIDLLRATADEALDNHPDDTELGWENPNTGHSGTIRVFGTKEVSSQICRQVFVKNNAIKIQGSAQYFVCKQDDGIWQITAPQ